MARSSIIGLWPMTSTDPLFAVFVDQREVAGCILAVELVAEQHAARVGLAGDAFQRLAGAQGIGAERDVGHVAAAAHRGAGGFRIGMAGRVERPVEVAHAGQRPAGFRVPQKKQPAHRSFLLDGANSVMPGSDLAMRKAPAQHADDQGDPRIGFTLPNFRHGSSACGAKSGMSLALTIA